MYVQQEAVYNTCVRTQIVNEGHRAWGMDVGDEFLVIGKG